jgi:hypothetical protein
LFQNNEAIRVVGYHILVSVATLKGEDKYVKLNSQI